MLLFDREFGVKEAEHQAQSWLTVLQVLRLHLCNLRRSGGGPALLTDTPSDGVAFQLKGLATIQQVTAQLGSLCSPNNGYLALSQC